jgi:hypothetical protein
MASDGGRPALIRIVVVVAVVAVGLLCGWTATGLTGGVVMALALGAGVTVATFNHRGAGGTTRLRCSRRRTR